MDDFNEYEYSKKMEKQNKEDDTKKKIKKREIFILGKGKIKKPKNKK